MKKIAFNFCVLISMVMHSQTLYYIESSTGLDTYKWEKGQSVIKMGDVNNDGNLDIVTVGDHGNPLGGGSTNNGIIVYLGDGVGNWTAKKSGGNFGYGGVALGDVNNDGKLDVGYGIHHNWGTQTNPSTDFGDQLMEVVLGNAASTPSWTPYDDGLGSNGETYGMFACDFADVDNDGLLDFGAISFGYGNGNKIYRNNGNGTWSLLSVSSIANTTSTDFIMADLNNDGNTDVFSGLENSRVVLGDGSGNFSVVEDPKLRLSNYEWWIGISTGDVDGNGTTDIAFCSDSVGPRVMGYDPNISGSNKWINLSGNLPKAVAYSKTALADMNKDGKMDLVLYGGGGIDVYLGDGTGNWVQDINIPTAGTNCNGLAVGDIDHDGFPDIATLTYAATNKLQVFKYAASGPVNLEIQSLTPGGGKCFKPGSSSTIDWLSVVPSGVATVKLELSLNDTIGPFVMIADSLPNNGHYQWAVPSNTNSQNCLIKYSLIQGFDTVSALSGIFGIGTCGITTSVHKDINKNKEMDLFPNPTNSTTLVRWGGENPAEVVVCDVLGNELMRSGLIVNQYLIDLKSQGAGLYFVKVLKDDGEVLIKKLLVQ